MVDTSARLDFRRADVFFLTIERVHCIIGLNMFNPFQVLYKFNKKRMDINYEKAHIGSAHFPCRCSSSFIWLYSRSYPAL